MDVSKLTIVLVIFVFVFSLGCLESIYEFVYEELRSYSSLGPRENYGPQSGWDIMGDYYCKDGKVVRDWEEEVKEERDGKCCYIKYRTEVRVIDVCGPTEKCIDGFEKCVDKSFTTTTTTTTTLPVCSYNNRTIPSTAVTKIIGKYRFEDVKGHKIRVNNTVYGPNCFERVVLDVKTRDGVNFSTTVLPSRNERVDYMDIGLIALHKINGMNEIEIWLDD